MEQLLTDTIEYLQRTAQQSESFVENNPSFRALSQLDARAANGETLSVIDEAVLRTKLECEVSADRERSEAVKSKILQALAILERPDTVQIEADDVAIATEPQHEGTKVELETETRIDFVNIEDNNPAIRASSYEAASKLLRDDDLCLIDGIGCALAAKLKQHNISRFAQIAQWTKDDIGQIADEKLSAHQIATENWIEQAAVLAEGKHTLFARRVLRDRHRTDKTLPVSIVSRPSENRSLVVVAQPEESASAKILPQAIAVSSPENDNAEPSAMLASTATVPIARAAKKRAFRGILGTVSISVAACTILLAAISIGNTKWSVYQPLQLRPTVDVQPVPTSMDEFIPLIAVLP